MRHSVKGRTGTAWKDWKQIYSQTENLPDNRGFLNGSLVFLLFFPDLQFFSCKDKTFQL